MSDFTTDRNWFKFYCLENLTDELVISKLTVSSSKKQFNMKMFGSFKQALRSFRLSDPIPDPQRIPPHFNDPFSPQQKIVPLNALRLNSLAETKDNLRQGLRV